MKRYFLSVCAALFALMLLCSVTTRAADNVYAILYDDGTLTFQHGNTPESGKTVTKTYKVDLNAVYHDNETLYVGRIPWYNERESVRVVNFADKITPTATAAWFYSFTNLERVDNIRNLDTAKVTNMSCMFLHCKGLTVLDLSHFDTAKVTDMRHMFFWCFNLKTIYASDKFKTESVTNSDLMFVDCASLVGGNGTKYDRGHIDREYARIDTPSAPGYFTSKTEPDPQPQPTPETYVITAYAGEGGTVTPAGDTRISAGGTQKYVMTPNPGYRVQSVRIDGVEVGALSEYVFQNVVTRHNLVAAFEKLPRYAITAAVGNGDELSVTLENSGAVIVAVWYADRNGKFLSADMQTVSANAGTVTFPLPFAYKARVTLLDSRYAPLCDPVAVR